MRTGTREKKQTKPRPVKQLFSRGKMCDLIKQARYLKGIERKILAELPLAISAHCQLRHFDGKYITLTVNNACWIPQLHACTAHISNQLKRDRAFKQLIKITYQVAPKKIDLAQINERHTEKVVRTMSKNTQSLLNDTAEYIENPELKAALQRLSEHGK